MVKALAKSKILATAAVLAMSVSWYVGKRQSAERIRFNAQCSFALVGSTMPTNALRKVALSEAERGTGPYQDSRIIMRDVLEQLLGRSRRSEDVMQAFVQSMKNSGVQSCSLTNAFLSADYRIDGESSNVVHLFAKGETKELALGVMDFILTNYVQRVKDEDRAREDKALAKLNWDIKRKRELNEDVSCLVDQLGRLQGIIGISRRRVVVITPPHLVE